MNIAITKADGIEVLAVINLSLMASYGYKKYEPIINSRGFKIISSSGMEGQEIYNLGYKKGTGIMDFGTIIFASNNAQSILKNAFSDYDFVLTKISSGSEPIPEESNPNPKQDTLPENEEKPESPEKTEKNEIQEESDSELDEIRQKIVDQARQYIGSTDWTKRKKRTSFDGEVTFRKKEPKCNLFVYEVLKQIGIDTGLPNNYGVIFKEKRPYRCKQWYAEEVPNFKCIGIGKEALKQSKPGDIITQGKHIGIITGFRKTISASSRSDENKVVESEFGWREDEQDIVKVFRYMGEGYSSKEAEDEKNNPGNKNKKKKI